MADRCTGRCCRDFIIRRMPEEIRKDAEEATPRWKKEFTKIADMVIPLGPVDSGYAYRYTCKHYDTNTNNCLDYENRPEMCRNYPYGDPCGFSECEWNPDSPRPDVSVVRTLRKTQRFRATAAVGEPPKGVVAAKVEAVEYPLVSQCGTSLRYRPRRVEVDDAISGRASSTEGKSEVLGAEDRSEG